MKEKIEKLIEFYKKELEDLNHIFSFYMETYNEKESDLYQTRIIEIERFIKELEKLLK